MQKAKRIHPKAVALQERKSLPAASSIKSYFKNKSDVMIDIPHGSIIPKSTHHYEKFSLQNPQLLSFLKYLGTVDGGLKTPIVAKEVCLLNLLL